MPAMNLKPSDLEPEDAVQRTVVPAGDWWMAEIRRGQTLRIVDVEGNEAADTLFYGLDNPQGEHYSAIDTTRRQGNVYLTTGTRLVSNNGNVMLTITADTCGRHDTLGGACSAEANQMRYALDKKPMHSCRDNFLHAIQESGYGLTKRDVASNINFFMNVPLTDAGSLRFEDGISGPGKYVEMRAEMDVIALVSNCPQLNNPCSGFDPTPLEMIIWD
ncbi:hypothetical protein EV698_1486 [Spiribacter vilamensis]|uniref:DUF1989 domain-containing protein n=2 Tax=Spiribacter vilamensis TaxID=531306 RepID=A0A4Q8D1M0_9GAMM|nr:hypothetical protein EV698_1486 [Spiribacter vilamensis]